MSEVHLRRATQGETGPVDNTVVKKEAGLTPTTPTTPQRRATGIQSLENLNLAGTTFSQPLIANRHGLELQTKEGIAYFAKLAAPQQAELRGLAQSLSHAMQEAPWTASVAAPESVVLPETVKTHLAGVVTRFQRGGVPLDVNALVQYVIRESYQQANQDLYFYAEKVKFFNNLKDAIRKEIKTARDELAKLAGKPEDAKLEPPYVRQQFNMKPTGGTAVTTSNNRGAVQQLWEQFRAQNKRVAGDAWFATEQLTSSKTSTTSSEQVVAQRFMDPLILDLDGDGSVETQDVASGQGFVVSSQDGQDVKAQTEVRTQQEGRRIDTIEKTTTTTTNTHDETRFKQWVGKDDGLVVMDRNRDGQIQAEDLFGDKQVTGRDAANAFADLAALDSNQDGMVDDKDGAFAELRVWQDADGDGVADAGELKTLTEAGVAGVRTAFEENADGTIRQLGTFKSTQAVDMEKALGEEALMTKGQLEAYVQDLEEKLNTAGDDAQLANVDLQNMLQKQQQALQTMSNISKSLHDTAMAVIRNFGG